MKQIAILFVLILYATASSDLLKSISKFADDGDNSSKFAKSTVSPFSEEESEDFDNEDTEPSKKITHNSQQDEDDEEVDVMAQLKSYQQKLSTNKDVKPSQPQKKQVQEISESESEYDDDDDSGNMWSRGISKKLAQTESKPLVLPIQTAKEQIKNEFNQFTSLKMPEVQQRPQETKIQDQIQKVQDDSGKEHSADFEKMKQAQLEKYSKRFHLDEPKESKSMYEDDSLKEFMPKINFQPINIQETKTSQQIQLNPEKKQENKHDEVESESDEEDDNLEINKKNSSPSNKKNNKVSNDLQSTSDAFDFFNQNKQQQKSNKKSQKIEQTESEDEDSETNQEDDNEEDEDYVQQVKKSKKQKDDREEQKRKQKQIQQQQEEEEEQRRIILKKQKEQQLQQEEIRKKQEEEERLQKLSKQQKTKGDFDEDQIPQKKKSKKQKKQLSLEDFQSSLKLDEEKLQLTSFAQKEAKEKAILEQKTFTLVKETPQQVQEQKVFKLQVIPKKQQQLIQEEESELESESESNDDEDFDTPKQINCFESKNKFIQQICQLCQTKVAYQVNQENWQKIGINDGFRYLLKIEFRQSFEPLIEFTFKSIGEIGSYYLSFKDHTVCLSAENLTKITNVDKVLKHFTGNQLADYNSPVDIPAKSQPINFLLSAEYDSLLNGFSCRRFQIAIKTDLKYKLSKKNDINVKQIIFYKNKLKLKYIGLIQINGVVHQASFDQEEGGEETNLIVTQLNLPKEQGVIASLVDKYIDSNFVADMLQKSEQMMADLQIQTHIKNDDIGLTFNLRKRKGK